jgi:hypothetical protein
MTNKTLCCLVILLIAIIQFSANHLNAQGDRIHHLSFNVHISDKKTISFLDSIQSEVNSKIYDYQALTSDIRIQQSPDDVRNIFDNKERIPSNSYRFSLVANNDLSEFIVIGFSQNYMVNSINSFDPMNVTRKDLFFLDPLFIMPLVFYKEFLNDYELEKLMKIIFESFKLHLFENYSVIKNTWFPCFIYEMNELSYLKHLSFDFSRDIKYRYFHLYEQPDLKSKVSYNHFVDNEIVITKKVFFVEDSLKEFQAINHLNGILLNIKCEPETDFSIDIKDSYNKSPLKIKVFNDFIGLYYDNLELNAIQGEFIKKTVWIEKESLYEYMDSEFFKHFIECTWKDKLFMKLQVKN